MTIRNLLFLVFVFFLFCPIEGFSQNYTLINDAAVYSGCNCYRLTQAINNQGGGVYQNNTINLNNSFDYTFNVFLGCNGASGADGIVFILTNNITGIGAQGGGLGYSGLPGNSFAVEYDTWQNSQDPAYDHIAFESGGSVNHNVAGPVSALASQSNIDDCAWHTTEIIWNVNSQTYSVYFDGVLRLTYTGNIVANFFGGNPIVNWGWSGSTGGGNNEQRFCVTTISSWVAGTNYESCSDTIHFQDISTSNVGTVQNWAWNFGDPGSGGNNTSGSQNPTHIYSGTGTYTVSLTITDMTGCTTSYSHNVVVNPPITMTPALTTPPCNGGTNGSISVSSTGGFGPGAGYGGYAYTWSNGSSGATDLGLTAGTYNVTVTDGVCSATASYSLTEPAPLTAVTSHTDAPCGGNTGSVTMTINGGTPPYSGVNWNLVPGYTRTNIPPNTYVADFHDANGCSSLLQYREVVNSLPCGYNVSTSSTDVDCYGASTGSVTLTVTGGTNPITISWTNSAATTVGNVASVSGLPADTYTYHYSDGAGHAFTGTVVVHQPGAAMVASLTTIGTTCSYLNNGSAVASVTANGSPPYNYSWSVPEPNSPTAMGLSAGAISVSITDSHLCSAVASSNISGQTVLSPSVSATDARCYLDNNGSATVSVTGGTPVYSYLWNNNGIGSTNYGIAAGTYTVTVTDHNSCTATASGVVGQPAVFTVNQAHVDVLCFGNSTGTITLTQAGGTTPYAAPQWLDGATGTTRSNLPTGTYYFADSDTHGCLYIDSVKILQPASAFSVSETHVNVKCKGAPTGSINLTLTGGTTPYGVVNWAGGATGAIRTNLIAGNYTYTVSDANGCSATNTINIAEPPTIFTVSQAHVDVLCFGNNTGSIALTQSGGTTPYAAPQWLDLAVGTTRSNLVSGTYYYADSDANGCLFIDSVKVLQPAVAFTVSQAHIDVLCFGNSTGTITLTQAGGTTPYATPQWLDGAIGTTRSNLPAGTYYFADSDAHGCLVIDSVIISQPTAFTVSESHVDVKCKGAPTGSITLTLTGGTTAYGTVDWGGGVTGSSISNLIAGNYTYTVADANNCSASAAINIAEPAAAFTVGQAHIDVLCFGNNTGSITLTQSGGTPPYAAPQWLDLATGTTRSNLVAGTYYYADSDVNGCLFIDSVKILQPTQLAVGLTKTDATCSYSADGSAVATGAGGVSLYNFAWSNAFTETGVATSTATGLAANTYTVTITDQNSCTASGGITVGSPPRLTAQITVTDVDCFGNSNGAVSVTAGGGTSGFHYTWSANAATGDQPTASNLAAALYSLTITDASNCVLDTFATVAQPTSALTYATPVFVQNVSCNGGNNGEIKYVVSGGTSNYTFLWSGSAAGSPDSAVNLIAGSYDVTITDSKGCSVTNTAGVTEPTALSIVSQSQIDEICHGGNTGSATVNVTGGTPGAGYTYTWTRNAGNTSTVSALTAGQYTVVITDNNQCTISANFNIAEPSQIVALPSVANALCHGGATGTVAISASGGTPAVNGYTYAWSPNVSSTDSGLSLLAGPYVVTVTDSLGCTAIANAQVGEPAALVPSITSVVNITCYGDSNGTVQLSASGGTSPYQFAISPDGVNFSGANSSGFFANLKPITYTGQVTDAHGCVNTIPVTLTAPDSVVVTMVIDTVKCYGESNGVITANASGGTPVYTFHFSNGVTNTSGIDQSLSAGTYQFTVTDSKGCAKQYSAIMEQPDSITISVTPTNPTIDLAESVNLLAASNATDANFNWSPSDGLNTTTGSAVTATSNHTTQYTITASNNPHGKECKVTTQVLVTVVPNYNIYVPNAFTPNNDGINDYFEVFGNKKAIQYIDIAIFDRWGEVVFRSNDLDFKWDGSYKGTMLEPGTFVYTMSVVFIDDHANSGYKGSLLLLR